MNEKELKNAATTAMNAIKGLAGIDIDEIHAEIIASNLIDAGWNPPLAETSRLSRDGSIEFLLIGKVSDIVVYTTLNDPNVKVCNAEWLEANTTPMPE